MFGLFDRGPVRGRDRARWVAARSLPDLCDLTVLWLDGRIKSTPGYYAAVDVDEDLAPGMTDALIALNAAGFLTDSSQGACDDPGLYSAAPWGAYVTGFADDETFAWLVAELARTRFEWFAHYPPVQRHRWWRRRPIGVQPPDGGMGAQSVRDLVALWGRVCGDGAVDALCAAWQVQVWDPVPGKNTLWPVLAEMAERHT